MKVALWLGTLAATSFISFVIIAAALDDKWRKAAERWRDEKRVLERQVDHWQEVARDATRKYNDEHGRKIKKQGEQI